MEPVESTSEELATDDDVRDAIEVLSDEDALRLNQAARACLPGTEYQDAQEIINEAVRRALDGGSGGVGRHWPKQRVPFVAFMIMTMKSIADGSRESDEMSKTDRLEGMAFADPGADHPLDNLGFSTPSVEMQAIEAEVSAEAIARASADAGKIDAFFENDQEVGWLILCIKEGRSAAKARELAGFSSTEYETIRKRLRRGAAKVFPGRRAR